MTTRTTTFRHHSTTTQHVFISVKP